MNIANDIIQTEVLIIGAGQAGILAAVECADSGKDVIIATKGPFGRDGAATWMAGWGNQMALYAPDSPEIHAADTIRAGLHVNDQRLVLALTEELPYVFEKLREWKIRYKIINDKVVQVEFPGGQSHPRILVLARSGEMGGLEYRRVLPAQVRKRPIRIIDDLIVFDLLINDGQVVGAVALNIQKGSFVTIQAKTTVLATGGFVGLYEYSTGSPSAIGDGLAMAYEAGAKLRDLEFVNFHSLIACWPPIIRGEPYVISLFYSLRGKILNKMGHDFRRHHPGKGRLSTSVMIQQEIRKGLGSPHGGVYCSFKDLPDNLIQDYIDSNPQKHLELLIDEAGVDIKRDAIEISPCPLASNGGCKIDEKCLTNVPGLLAIGEVAGGHEGAYTMAGNTIALQFAMGSIAGKTAAKMASETRHIPCSRASVINEVIDGARSMLEDGSRSGPSPIEMRKEIQRIMYTYLNLLGRDKESLTQCIGEIARLKEDSNLLQLKHRGTCFNMEWVDGIEFKKSLVVAQLAARAALAREESRGFHYREDFPESDDKWIKTVCLQKEREDMNISIEDIETPFMDIRGR